MKGLPQKSRPFDNLLTMKCIYLRTNLVNGKQYVGQTNDFKRREIEWKCLKANYSSGIIDRARKKYGLENWKVEILRECETQDELNKWEIYYIKELSTKKPNGYNLTDGGFGNSGHIVSEETKKKVSIALKGKYTGEKAFAYGVKRTEEQKQHLREIHLGKKHSEETKKKISEAHKGKRMSDEAKKKISETNKGREPWLKGKHLSYETKNKISKSLKGKKYPKSWKKVYQYTLDGKFVAAYDSPSLIKDKFRINHIFECCNGLRKTHKGYKWSYKPL